MWQRKNWPFYTPGRFRGFRVCATDTDWSSGTGFPVTAPIAAILPASTGRPVGLLSFEGENVAELRSRLPA